MELKRNLNIFIVDDDPFYCILYENYLRMLGFRNIHTFMEGQECLNNLSLHPDIVLLDYKIDDVNGLTILKNIQNIRPGIFSIVISAQTDMLVVIEMFQSGAFDYVIKGENDLDKITTAIYKICTILESLTYKKLDKHDELLEFLPHSYN